MQQIIEDIRNLLKDRLFKDEQHVRFSLVGRICQALGWNIWNPEEFYTEYPVKKFPPQDVTKELRGRVDVALMLPEKHSGIAEVFIEVKTPYKLQSEIESGEKQLDRYNWCDKAAICILTDGIIWRFYLPSLGGTFENSVFSEINLLEDDIMAICIVFDQVLKRENFRKQATENAEALFGEIARIKILSHVKSEAEDIARKTGMQKFTIASQLLKNQHSCELDESEIAYLWNKRIPKVTQLKPVVTPPVKPDDIIIKLKPTQPGMVDFTVEQDYSYKSARVVVVGGKTTNVSHWWEIKERVFNYLIEMNPALASSNSLALTARKNDSMDIQLINGMFSRGRMSATDIVKQCRAAMRIAGYDPLKDLLIGYVESERKRKGQ